MIVRPAPQTPLLTLDLAIRGWLSEKHNIQTLVVEYGDRRVPLLPLRGGQWRALLPTTPLDDPGELQLQIIKQGIVPRVIYDSQLTLRGKEFGVESIWLPASKSGNNQSSSLDDDEVGSSLRLYIN